MLKKAPGVVEGTHYICVLSGIHEGVPIEKLPDEVIGEIFKICNHFAWAYAVKEGAYRIAMNGSCIGTRNHFHIHIILPAEGEKLDTIVSRT